MTPLKQWRQSHFKFHQENILSFNPQSGTVHSVVHGTASINVHVHGSVGLVKTSVKTEGETDAA